MKNNIYHYVEYFSYRTPRMNRSSSASRSGCDRLVQVSNGQVESGVKQQGLEQMMKWRFHFP
jgi:hypothetical protein